ncbi:MAG TPA: hypothetical protein VMR97_07860 [Acidimicrobiales bacterium]|nr:hypothetical protein [Acidimicrobiales bacterium]
MGALHELVCPTCGTKRPTKAQGRQKLRCTGCGALLTAGGVLVASESTTSSTPVGGPTIAAPLTLRLPRPVAPEPAEAPKGDPPPTNRPAPVRTRAERERVSAQRKLDGARRGGKATRRTAASWYAERVRNA